ncbi:MAG: shikimate dehydrogenase [Peptococcia bacterium]
MKKKITGRTKIFAILGQPLEHTLSPVMYNEAFELLNYDGVYLPCPVPEGKLAEAVQGIRALGIRGGNVTIPYKEKIIPYLDSLTDEAKLIGAVNTFYWEGDSLIGANTDGSGFLQAITQFHPPAADFPEAVILGAGGAAKAVGVVLALAGYKKIFLVNRDRKKAEELGQTLDSIGCKVDILPWSDPGLEKVIGQVPLVINATPLGMNPAFPSLPPIPYESLNEQQLVVDLIYHPTETLFLRKAKERGCLTMNGLAMLLEQGVLSFGMWTGIEAPKEEMEEILRRWL